MNETPKLYEALSHVVRAARKERKMPQMELAKRMGCARSFVSSIEAGQLQLSINAFLCMAKAFEIEPEELLKRLKSALLVLNNRRELSTAQDASEMPSAPEPKSKKTALGRKMGPF